MSKGREHIVVVDDNEAGRYTKVRILRQAGFDVLEADSGAQALALVRERRPRLAILDVQLPDIDGWEICRRIKNEPETASVLVLQMSATYVNDTDTVRALDGGADACLTEPTEASVLVATVRALLRLRDAEDAVRESLAREQAARQAAEAASRAKDEFLATLSHELRSPLSSILTWAGLLRAGALSPEQTEHALDVIQRNTRLQAKLIEDLLDVSRIVSGKMLLERTHLDLVPVVEAAIESVRPVAEEKHINIRASQPASPLPILGDPARLQQVVWNLLTNAVKFTEPGGIVDVAVHGGERAEVRVSDTGRGIDPKFLPHIFERFRQADASSTRSESGLGLGLAIVRHLVELHGGTIEAASPGLGAGAVFTIRLPLLAAEETGTKEEGGDSESGLPDLSGVEILVLEDDDDAREVIALSLRQLGAGVMTASSVGAAMEALASRVPTLVISDIAMPGEDGYAFIRRLRALPAERGGQLPALALTAFASDQDQHDVLAAGFQAHVAKPVEVSHLARCAAQLAGRG